MLNNINVIPSSRIMEKLNYYRNIVIVREIYDDKLKHIENVATNSNL